MQGFNSIILAERKSGLWKNTEKFSNEGGSFGVANGDFGSLSIRNIYIITLRYIFYIDIHSAKSILNYQ